MSIMKNNQKPFPQSSGLARGEKHHDGETTALR
jgi:hypothetical protein